MASLEEYKRKRQNQAKAEQVERTGSDQTQSLADYKAKRKIQSGEGLNLYNSLSDSVNKLSKSESERQKLRRNTYQSPEAIKGNRDLYSLNSLSSRNQASEAENYYTKYKDLIDEYYGEGTSSKILESIGGINSYINDTSYLDDEAKYWSNFSSQDDYDAYNRWLTYQDINKNDDYAENSKYVSTYSPGTEKFSPLRGYYTNTGFGDITYDYINKNETALDRQQLSDIQNNSALLGLDESYLKQMTDDQISNFNYLYKTQGSDAAYQYVADIKDELTYKQRQATQDQWSSWANEEPGKASLFSVLEKPLETVSYIGQIADWTHDGKINPNEAYNKFAQINTDIRNEVSTLAENKWGEKGSQAYQLGMSMADSLMNMLPAMMTGGQSATGKAIEKVMLGVMGSNAAAETVMNLASQGYTDTQSMVLGTIAGIAEYITERIGVEAVFNMPLLKESIAKYLLQTTLAEATEEGLADVINWLSDGIYTLITGNESQFQRLVQENGGDISKAIVSRAKELGKDMLGGGISGLLFGLGGMGVNAGKSVITKTANTVSNVRNVGETNSYQDLINEGLSLDQDSKAYNLAKLNQETLQNNGKLSAYQTLRQTLANNKAITAEEKVAQTLIETATKDPTNLNVNKIIENESAVNALGLNLEGLNDKESRNEVKKALANRSEEQTEDNKANTPTEEKNAQVGENVRMTQTDIINNQINADEKLVNDFAKSLGTNGNLSLRNLYRKAGADINVTDFVTEYTRAYNQGYNGSEIQATGNVLTNAIRQEAYQAGALDSREDLNESNGRSEERTSYLGGRGSVESNRRRAEETGRRTASQAKRAESLRNSVNAEEKVSAKEAGIINGTDRKSVTIVPRESYNKSCKAVDKSLSKLGYNVKFFTGEMEVVRKDGKKTTVRGAINGKNIWIKADHKSLTVEQIANHELFHDLIKGDPTLLNKMRKAIVEKYSDDELQQMVKSYVDEYGWTNMTNEEILEEICADAYAGIDIFDYLIYTEGATKYTEVVKEVTNNKDVSANQTRGAPEITAEEQALMDEIDFSEDPRKLKESDARILLQNAIDGKYDNNTFIPVRATTPYVAIQAARRFNIEVKQLPMLMKVNKAIQAMSPQGYYTETGIGHNLSVDDVISLLKNLNEPDYVLYDSGNSRTYEIVRVGDQVTKGFAVVDFNENKDEMYINGYQGGTYNILVTAYSTNENYLYNQLDRDGVLLLFDKNKKGMSQRASSEKPLSDLNDKPFYEENISDAQEVVNSKNDGVKMVDGSVVKTSEETWNKTDKDKLLADLIEAGFERSDALKWINDVNSIGKLIADERDRLDYIAAEDQTMVKKDSEYYKTIDSSTLCAKRLLYQGTYNAIQHALPNYAITPDDTIAIRRMMDDRGYEVPCGFCYVESRRKNLGNYVKGWVEEYGKGITVADVTTTDGLADLKINNPDAYNSFIANMNKKDSNNPKVVEPRTSYKAREIMKLSNSTIEKVKHIGGLRIQSFSDFETPHLIDMMQAIMDMSARGLTSQAYTKVPNFAAVFGNTGVKINLSIVGDVDANGRLTFNDKEGMPIKEALKLRKKYSKNVGTILVGKNEAHIRAAMGDYRIDFMIPFHASGWAEGQYEALGIGGYLDHTLLQHDVKADYSPLDASRKKAGGNYFPDDYWDYSVDGNTNAMTYLNMCLDDGRLPRFLNYAFETEAYKAFIDVNPDLVIKIPSNSKPVPLTANIMMSVEGMTALYASSNKGRNQRAIAYDFLKFALENGYQTANGYWKMLGDFKMYDNDGNGSPQLPVQPTFNMQEARRILREYDGNPNTLPAANDVVRDFVKRVKESGAKFSEDSEGNSLTKEQIKYFKNSKVLDDNGNLRVVYHGTNENFTVFDRTKGRANMDIQGLFFTPFEIDASGYGDIVGQYYLNITNPADEATAYKALNMFKGQNGAGIKARDYLISKGYDGVYNGYDEYIAFTSEQVKEVDNYNPTFNPDVRYSEEVTDRKTLDFLNDQISKGEVTEVFRAMQVVVINGQERLVPPMAGKIAIPQPNGKNKWVWQNQSSLHTWEKSTEITDFDDALARGIITPTIYKDGRPGYDFKLKKGGKFSDVPAAYNPYIHTSLSTLNDQFTSAYKRPNLRIVRGYVPNSEINNPYSAKYAKDSTGRTKWHNGVVAAQMPETREVILSRYFYPVEIMDNDVVAQKIKDQMQGRDIEIPYNVVSPGLRRSLENIGVTIGEGQGLANLPSKDSVKYSEDKISDLSNDNEQLRKELSNVRATLKARTKQRDYWRIETTIPGKIRLDPKDVNKLSKSIINDYDGSINYKDISQRVNDLAVEILGKKYTTYNDIKIAATEIAHDIINSSQELVSDDKNAYDEIRSIVNSGKGLYLSPQERSNISDWGKYRNSILGYVKVSNTGRNVDSVYNELNEKFEGYFPKEVSDPAEQLQKIVDVMQTLTPVYANPYSYRMAEATEYCANDLIRRIMDGNLNELPPTRMETAVKNERAKAAEAIAIEKKNREDQVKAIKQKYADINATKAWKQGERNAQQDLLKIARRLQKLKTTRMNRALIDQFIGELDTVSVFMTDKTVNRLSELRDWYLDQKENNPDFLSDAATEQKLERLSKTSIAEYDYEAVLSITEILQNIENQIRTQRKLIDAQDRRDTYIQAEESINNIRNQKGVGRGAIKQLNDMIVTNTLSPVREINRIVGYNETDPLYKVTQALVEGQRKMLQYQHDVKAPFNKWTDDKLFIKSITGKKAGTIEITGFANGKRSTVKINRDLLMSLYMHSFNDDNLRHIEKGGITIPDLDTLNNGDIVKAYARGKTLKFTPSEVKALRQYLTTKEKAYCDAARTYFNEISKGALNETSELLLGYSVAQVDNYYPINTDTNFTKADFESIKMDGTIEGMGILKERKNFAGNPIMLRGFTSVLNTNIDMHSKYVGLAIPVRNFNKLWKVSISDYIETADGHHVVAESYTGSIPQAISNVWEDRAMNYIEKMMSDIQGNKRKPDEIGKWLSKARSNYAGSVLTLNLSVAMKQAASYPTAGAVIGWKPLFQAFKSFGKVDLDLIAKYTPLQWYRGLGYSTTELGDVAGGNKQIPKFLNWIQFTDLITTRKLWKACEYYVNDNYKDLEVGSDGYYRQVADAYNRVIEETQPNYTTMQRPQLLRSDNALVQNTIAMFKTQPFQNFGILYDALGNFQAKGIELKNASQEGYSLAKAKYDSAKKDAFNAISSQIVQLLVFSTMTYVWNMMKRKKDKYANEDGEVTFWSTAKGIGKDMISGAASIVPFGSDVYELLDAIISGDKYYGSDVIASTAIYDMMSAFYNMSVNLRKVIEASTSGQEVDWDKYFSKLRSNLEDMSKLFNIPLENVHNLYEIVYNNIKAWTE